MDCLHRVDYGPSFILVADAGRHIRHRFGPTWNRLSSLTSRSFSQCRFKQAEIDAFARRVEAHGGRLIRHVFLPAGRIFWQKSREELLREIRAEMEAFK
jgi:hypothetical protein